MAHTQGAKESERQHTRALNERVEGHDVGGGDLCALNCGVYFVMRDVVDAVVFIARSSAFGILI